jgi:hypothetical protein
MAFIYTRSQLKSDINRGIQGKIGMLVDEDDTVNEVVRDVLGDVDLRSARRKASLTPALFNGIFDYAWPTDGKSQSIIDIPAQAREQRQDGSFFLIPSEEFEVKRPEGAIAIDHFNGIAVLKVKSQVEDHTILISELDSLTSGGGTWVLFGDGTNLSADNDDYIKGNGSIKWDISAAGGTTAGIQNTGLNSFDISDYLDGNGSIFVWVKINSTTDLTNFILRIGSSSGNYYSKTVTTTNDGTAFANGWNLLRFNLTSLTETGSVTDTAITFAAIYMTKAVGKISETDYKFDWLVLKRGVTHDLKYYSKYGWNTSAGVYLENSTSDSDVLVADTDEYNLIVKKGRWVAGLEVDLPFERNEQNEKIYDKALADYKIKNPSESKIQTNQYYVY